MAKSNLEKAIEKQQREAKKMAEQEARRQRASIIVYGQPLIGGMRIMDSAAEEILQIILSQYNGSENREVRGNYDVIPNAYGSNIFFGDVTNSSFSIDNSISNIEKEIAEKGGDDAEELKAILDEVKELIENIDDSRHIPKNKGLFQKITGHLDKHGWFYAEIVGLLGTAAIQLLGG